MSKWAISDIVIGAQVNFNRVKDEKSRRNERKFFVQIVLGLVLKG